MFCFAVESMLGHAEVVLEALDLPHHRFGANQSLGTENTDQPLFRGATRLWGISCIYFSDVLASVFFSVLSIMFMILSSRRDVYSFSA